VNTKRRDLKQVRRRVLLWLIMCGTPVPKTTVARALGLDWEHYPVILDHWWFRYRDGRVWLSEDGARELTGRQQRAYDAGDHQ
jgi:hypothetical protein